MVEDALEEGEIEGLVNESPPEQVRAEPTSVDVMPAALQGYGRPAWEEAHKEAEEAKWGEGLF